MPRTAQAVRGISSFSRVVSPGSHVTHRLPTRARTMTRRIRLAAGVACALLCGLAVRGSAAEPAADLVAPGWVLERWTKEGGLPVSTVYSGLPEPSGRMVFGTTDGLLFYDGRSVQRLRAGDPGGPPADRVPYVYPDARDGAIWVIAESGRLQRRHQGVHLEFPPLTEPNRTLTFTVVRGVPHVFSGSGVWALENPPFVRDDVPEDTLWVYGDERGEYRVDIDWSGWFRPDADTPWRRMPDVDGRSLLLELRGPPSRPAGVWVDDEGVHADAGLVEPGGAIVDLVQVGAAWWYARSGAGIRRLRRTPFRVHRPPPPAGPRTDKVLAIPGGVLASSAADQGWFAPGEDALMGGPALLEGQLLDELDPTADGGWPRYGLVPWVEEDGRWWVGPLGLLPELEDGSPRRLGPTEVPTCFHGLQAGIRRADGSTLLGTGWARRDGEWGAHPAGPCEGPFAQVRSLAEVPGGVVTAPEHHGLWFVGDDGSARRLPTPPGLRARHVRVDAGLLWVATEDRGLCLSPLALSHVDEWRCLGPGAGLPVTQVHASLPDAQGRLWISTNDGFFLTRMADVARFARGEGDEVPAVAIGARWGLENPELNGFAGFSALATAESLWFPSQGGLVEVRPADLTVPTPEVAVAQMRLGAEVLPLGGPVRLAEGHEPLVVELVSTPLEWAPATSLRYRVGEGPWRETRGRLELRHLPAGVGRIEVQARLLGEWSEAASIGYDRAPRPSERALFPLAVGLALALGLVGLFGLRSRSLRRRSDLLEAQVAERTAELATQARTVREQAVRLSELDELKNRFIADMAHELRTPLTLTLGALEPKRANLDVARRNAERLHELVEELFDLSRLQAGALRMRARSVALHELVEESVERHRTEFEARGRSLRATVEPGRIWADPRLVVKVLENLLRNALVHGDGAVEARVEVLEESVLLSVEDAGPGVPEEDRERVFERFVQLSTGDTRSADGAGIGLALVAEVAALHGGEARITGAGARFEVELPLGSDHIAIEDLDLADGPRNPPGPRAAAEGRQRILLVEDNPELREYMASLLSERWAVLEAGDGAAGHELARRELPLAIVSDVRMPGVDGLEMARRLKGDPVTAGIPLLFVSAKTLPADRVAGLELADDYLAKPFGTQELMLRVARLVQRALAAQKPGSSATDEEGGTGSAHLDEWRRSLEQVMNEHLEDASFGVTELARALGMSTRSLNRRANELGLSTPRALLREARLSRARELLRAGAFETVGEVAGAVGLSRAYFTRAYRAWSGHPPGDDLQG